MARGRAYSLDFRIAMMKQHAQGRSFATLSRETDVPRDVLRRWWHRYDTGGEAALRPRSRRPRHSPTQVSNGKVERFIKTVDDECLAVYHPQSCAARTNVVDQVVWYYNHQRPHLSLAGQTPVHRPKLT